MNPVHKLIIPLFFFHFLFLPNWLIAQNGKGWELKKDDKGIKVYGRETSGSKIKELRFTTEFPSSLSAVAALLLDLDHFDEWSYGSRGTKLVKRVSVSEFYYYAEIVFPWPVSNRDIVLHSRLWQEKTDNSLHQKINAVKGMLAEKDKLVRIEYTDLHWHVVPLPGGRLQINYLMKTDPGGNLPAWMINLAADQGPMKTILQFREMLKLDKYRKASLPFIVEP